MAKVTLMPGFVQELHGSLGKNSDLIFRTMNGKVCVYKKSERPVRKKATPVQVDHRERFKQVTECVRKALADELMKRYWTERWKASGKKKYATVRGWLVSELMKV